MEHEWYFATEGGKKLLVAPDSRWFRSGRLIDKILETHPEEKGKILVLGAQHTSVVKDWGVREADLVRFDSEPFTIYSVSRLTEPVLARSRLDFEEDIVEGVAVEHPTVEVPITVLGDVTTFLIRARAPHGLGGEILYTGDTKSGKTWSLRQIIKAYMAVAEQRLIPDFTAANTDWLWLNAGERLGDVRKTRIEVLQRGKVYTSGIQEVYSRRVPNGTFSIEHFVGFSTPVLIKNARFCRAREHRIMESNVVLLEDSGEIRHLVFIIDSIWGQMQGMTQASKEGGGLAGKGISRDALREGQSYLFAGHLPNGGTLSIFATLLRGAGGAESVYEEIGGNLSTGEVCHRMERDRSIPRPWLDFNSTDCRETAMIFEGDPERERFHLDLQHYALEAGEGSPGKALGYLRKLAEEIGWNPPAIYARWQEEERGRERKPSRAPRERQEELVVELPPIEIYIELGEELVAEGLLDLGIGRIDAKNLRDKGLTPDEVRVRVEETRELPL